MWAQQRVGAQYWLNEKEMEGRREEDLASQVLGLSYISPFLDSQSWGPSPTSTTLFQQIFMFKLLCAEKLTAKALADSIHALPDSTGALPRWGNLWEKSV